MKFFGRAGLLLAAVLSVAQPASAQSLPGWIGFYVGMHGGWSSTSSGSGTAVTSTTAPFVPVMISTGHDLGADGAMFGGHAGYNWQLNQSVVVGIEGDFTGTNLNAASVRTPSCPPGVICATVPATVYAAQQTLQQEINWLASVRGRVGYTWGPGLIYVTGGAAWADINYKGDTGDGFLTGCGGFGCAYPAAASQIKSGYVLGGGYEGKITPSWIVRAEYLFYKFGGTTIGAAGAPAANCAAGGFATCSTSYTFPDLDIHSLRVGLSYNFSTAGGADPGARAAYAADLAAVAVANWFGIYVGLHAGWGWASSGNGSAITIPTAPAVRLVTDHDLGADGAVIGGHLGYNWQFSPNWILGLEGDFTGTSLNAASVRTPSCPNVGCALPRTTFSAQQTLQQDINWLASIRGRVGYAFGSAMVYVTGGFAWADVDYKGDTGDGFVVCVGNVGCAYPASLRRTTSGYAAGGGYEGAITPNWIVRAEYLFYRFDGATIIGAGVPPTFCPAPCSTTYTFPDFDIHSLRVGLSYKF